MPKVGLRLNIWGIINEKEEEYFVFAEEDLINLPIKDYMMEVNSKEMHVKKILVQWIDGVAGDDLN